jgi:hypothetical protein
MLVCFCFSGLIGRARSPCVSFSVLMSILSKSLDAARMNLILTSYDDFRVWSYFYSNPLVNVMVSL